MVDADLLACIRWWGNVFVVGFELFVYFTLIDADIIDEVFGRNFGFLHIATIVPAECKVDDDVLWVMKWVFRTPFCVRIEGVGEFGFIDQAVIDVETNGFRIPVHPPDMKGVQPFLTPELRNRDFC